MIFLTVYLICASLPLDFLLYLAKPTTTIDHSAAVEKWYLELNLWPWSLTLTFKFDLDHWPLTSKQVERQQNIMSKHVSSLFELDLWPTTLTYIPNLANVLVNPHAKNQGRRSNGWSVRAITDGRTDGRTDTTKRIISPAYAVDNQVYWLLPPTSALKVIESVPSVCVHLLVNTLIAEPFGVRTWNFLCSCTLQYLDQVRWSRS